MTSAKHERALMQKVALSTQNMKFKYYNNIQMNIVDFNNEKPYVYQKYIQLKQEAGFHVISLINPLVYKLTKSNPYQVIFSIENTFLSARQTILFIHGYGGTSLNWLKLIKNLDKKFNCIAIDIPGSGFSSKQFAWNYEKKTHERILQYYETRIMNFLRKKKIKQPIICCHSFGGFIGSYVIYKNPQYFKRAILLSPFPGDQNFLSLNLFNSSIKILMSFLNYYPQKAYNFQKVQQIFLKSCHIKDNIEEWKKYLNDIANSNQQSSSQSNFFILFSRIKNKQFNISRFLKDISIPVLCLYGDTDWMPRQSVKALALKNHHIKILEVQNIDHQVQMSDLIYIYF